MGTKCTTMQIYAVTECPNLNLNNITLIKANEFEEQKWAQNIQK